MVKIVSRDNKAHGIMVVVALICASSVIVARGVAGSMPPAIQAVIRCVAGISVLLPFAVPEIKRNVRPAGLDWLRLIVMGLLGIAISLISFLWGIQYTSATNASIIFASNPAVTILLLAVFWRKPQQLHQIVGMSLSFAGLLLVITQGSWLNLRSLRFNVGDVALIFNIIVFSIYTIVGQGVMGKYSPLLTGFYTLVFGTLFLMPLGIWQGLTWSWHASWGVWLAVLYCGISLNGLAFFLNLWGIQRIGSGKAAIFGNLQPVFGFLLAVMFLGEQLAIYHWSGLGLVLVGVLIYISSFKTSNTEKRGFLKKKSKLSVD